MPARSASAFPSGVAKALRHRANGCRIGACDVPKRTKVSASAGSAASSARYACPYPTAPRQGSMWGATSPSMRPPDEGEAREGRSTLGPALSRQPRSMYCARACRSPWYAPPACAAGRTVARANSASTRARASRKVAPSRKRRRSSSSASRTTTSTGTSTPRSLRDGGRDFVAGEPSHEARDDRHQRRRDDRMALGDALGVTQEEHAPVLPVGDDDRFDGAKGRSGVGNP